MSSEQRRYREVFFAHNGPGPYACCFCGEEVTFDDVLVHHEDGDRDNETPENLKPTHDPCHTRHHNSLRVYVPPSAEARAKMSASMRGRKNSAEHCRKVGDAQRGKPKSQAHRAAMEEGQRRRRRREREVGSAT